MAFAQEQQQFSFDNFSMHKTAAYEAGENTELSRQLNLTSDNEEAVMNAVGGWGKWAAFMLKRIASGLPVVGTIVDVISAICNFAGGNYLGGILDLISAIPAIGDVVATPLQFALKFKNKMPPGMLKAGQEAMDLMISKVDEAMNAMLKWELPDWAVDWGVDLKWFREQLGAIRSEMKRDISTRRAALKEWPPMNIRAFKSHPDMPAPQSWHTCAGGRKVEVDIKDNNILDYLKQQDGGGRSDWVKVYHDGMNNNGQKVSFHYFFNRSNGRACDLKVKSPSDGWSN